MHTGLSRGMLLMFGKVIQVPNGWITPVSYKHYRISNLFANKLLYNYIATLQLSNVWGRGALDRFVWMGDFIDFRFYRCTKIDCREAWYFFSEKQLLMWELMYWLWCNMRGRNGISENHYFLWSLIASPKSVQLCKTYLVNVACIQAKNKSTIMLSILTEDDISRELQTRPYHKRYCKNILVLTFAFHKFVTSKLYRVPIRVMNNHRWYSKKTFEYT